MTFGSHSATDSIEPDSPKRIAFRLVSSTHSRLHRGPARTRSLLPVIGADDVILPSFDEVLGAFAIRAQEDDREARDALYSAFLPKLTRLMIAARPPHAPAGAEGIWNQDDVEQEAYLIFLELVETWSGDVSFTAYVLSRFPWRLKDAIWRGIGKPSVPPRQIAVPVEDAHLIADDVAASPDAQALLDAILTGLPAPLDAVLMAHVLEGKTKTEIARALGISRRTMVRYWQDIRAHAASVLGDGVRGRSACRQHEVDSAQCKH